MRHRRIHPGRSETVLGTLSYEVSNFFDTFGVRKIYTPTVYNKFRKIFIFNSKTIIFNSS